MVASLAENDGPGVGRPARVFAGDEWNPAAALGVDDADREAAGLRGVGDPLAVWGPIGFGGVAGAGSGEMAHRAAARRDGIKASRTALARGKADRLAVGR